MPILAALSPAHAQEWTRPVTVSIAGEVRKPGSYTLPPRSPLSALLLAAGGFTDNAFLRGAVLTRTSARNAHESELREMAARLIAEAGSDPEPAAAVRPLSDFLKGVRPAGRVPVKLSLPRLLKGSPADIPLEEGDVLRIPGRTGDVGVTGEVRAGPRAVPFAEKDSWEEYVALAGGYAGDADRDRVYLLRADGTAALLSLGFVTWNPAASRWEVTALAGTAPSIGPGDTVVVPRRPAPGVPKRVARELPRILMRVAEIAGAPVVFP